MDKKALREKYRAIRNSVTKDTAVQNLLNWDVFKNAITVFTYISTKGEADTYPLLKTDKKILVPVTFKGEGVIKPCVFYGEDSLKKGEYGILEPKTITVFDKNKIDLVIVPAICFNVKGYRVGYGGGYYDKFLQDYKGTTVGLCFEQCITDVDFMQAHDKRVDYIITQERIIKV